ncbi:MAG TPA: Maf family protein [Terriglobales bacterium]|nr:Maf family protein [Terriglobales bacterium]
MELILASSSPRRQELLRAAGISFTVRPSNIPEDPLPEEAPIQFSERLAKEKAAAVRSVLPSNSGALVLAADTIVVVDNEVLGKPADAKDAARMLRMISGRAHQVITSVCLSGSGFQDVRSESTVVCVNGISEQEIAEYIASGEPMDKAGAYGIQGLASRWIPRVEGDYSNVVGLPIALVYRMLKKCGAFGHLPLQR